ncbi:2-dehydro-3-deoxygalactonokinase [Jiulongibacter sp. NS-SX5]|uniref:2-dehydro-3-deoxygalactonokinase n=1 Tax=Jiulongibacter sp. NS-SX5 TaxID=3463854 RepID=UPI00405A3A7D
MIDQFISCDWGTSNFRLRLVKTSTLESLELIENEFGIKRLTSNNSGLDSSKVCLEFLKEQLSGLRNRDQAIPLVISGMASSNLGLKELPYGELPCSIEGDKIPSIRLDDLFDGQKTILISGLRSSTSLMRGEETQAIGLSAYLKGTGVLILPGTHSKHMYFSGGQFKDFNTFMTGELFETLSTQTILSGSITKAPNTLKQTFFEGLEAGFSGKLTKNLFYIRYRGLMETNNPEHNGQYLSGLLIGDELKDLGQVDTNIILASTGILLDIYSAALEHLFESSKFSVISEAEFSNAILRGQLTILEQHA